MNPTGECLHCRTLGVVKSHRGPAWTDRQTRVAATGSGRSVIVGIRKRTQQRDGTPLFHGIFISYKQLLTYYGVKYIV